MKKQNKLDKKRKREGKTNYTKRLRLLQGGHSRLVIRKSARYITLQVVNSNKAQDNVLYTVSTKDLLSCGWPKEKQGSLKSLGAAYLTGFLLAKRMKKGSLILDSGLIPHTKGSRLYAAVKGIADGGVTIPFDEAVVPDKKRIEKDSFFNTVKGGIK